jgi:hypothetical protein
MLHDGLILWPDLSDWVIAEKVLLQNLASVVGQQAGNRITVLSIIWNYLGLCRTCGGTVNLANLLDFMREVVYFSQNGVLPTKVLKQKKMKTMQYCIFTHA